MIATRHGPARATHIVQGNPRASLVLTHGAGGGIDAPDLQYIAKHQRDIDLHLIEMPWRVAGKKIAPRPVVLDQCWLDVMADLAPRMHHPLVVGGRSAGARVALRTAEQLGAAGVLALAFPLHPPGAPERTRADELRTDLPVVVVQGGKDPFGRPAEFPPLPNGRLLRLEGAGHSLSPDPLLLQAIEQLLVLIASQGAGSY